VLNYSILRPCASSPSAFLDLAEKQIAAPVKARQRAGELRADKALEERSRAMRLWCQWRQRQLDDALAGPYGPKFAAFLQFLDGLTLDRESSLIPHVEPWRSADERGSRVLITDDLSTRAVEAYQQSGPDHYVGFTPTFARACREADVARARAVAEAKRTGRPAEPRGAAPTTVEAAMYQLREAGVGALRDPSCQRRLGEMSNGQLKEVIGRLKALQSRYPRITREVIAAIAVKLRRRSDHRG